MTNTLGILLAAIIAALSFLHIHWALGGSFGRKVTVPSIGGRRTFNPSPSGTMLIALALLLAMFTILGQIGLLGRALPRWIFRWGTLSISLLFFLRAVGDFRMVGFFKRVRKTPFAYWDTRVFSPLCVVIALLALIVALG
jgi:hypothetical protein